MNVRYGKNKLLTVDEILVLTYKHITKMRNGRLPRKRILATNRVKLTFTKLLFLKEKASNRMESTAF
jgi:hypothetical protein